ncbi:DUF6263 family protein [Ohtaekwangia koreensis]|uniref:Uncharacterized protein n=1 Tax=Ohtaekwangia koreensis TaxID=688867 RepID=A0A1T5LFN7_9BACT|nr:DUF6263 family protein [Ohtaekwangia koreensis]SKC74812.1 hypothetical protein SAMN05660236_3138 [Ohtaekwangia koreensis]
MKALRFVVLFFVVCAFTNPAKLVKLEYIFKVGDVHEWVQVSKQTITQDIPGAGEMTIKVAIDGGMQLKVVELTGKGAKVQTTYSKIKMIMNMPPPMGDVTMDSEGADDNMQNKMMKSMTQKPFFIYMNKEGIIEKVEGTENLYSGISELGLEAAAAAQAKQSLQQAMSEQSIKASIEMSLMQYSPAKVKTGDTWKNTVSTALNFPMQINNTWTFEKLEGTVASITSDGTVVTTDKEKTTTINGMQAKVDLNGRQMTKGTVDIKSGWPIKMEVISEIKGKMTLLAGGMLPQDTDVPMEILSESTFTIK